MAIEYITRYCLHRQKGKTLNSVSIIGRLVKDPEISKTEGGLTICNLRFAVDDTFSKEDRADFVNVTVFGNQGENCNRYLRKGFIAGVSGRIRTDVYTDSEGVKRYPVKIIGERIQFLQWPERKELDENKPSPPEAETVNDEETVEIEKIEEAV
jgi:single stranded DNA-binding protein (ssb)